MTTQLERIEYELRKAGFNLSEEKENIDTLEDYTQAIGTSVWKVCKEFCSHDHSGMSAGYALKMIKTLLIEGKPLSPLTNDPEEWTDISEPSGESTGTIYQSKRDSSCFSDDGLKTYYDIDAEENNEWEVVDGKRTGFCRLKNKEDRHFISLSNCKE